VILARSLFFLRCCPVHQIPANIPRSRPSESKRNNTPIAEYRDLATSLLSVDRATRKRQHNNSFVAFVNSHFKRCSLPTRATLKLEWISSKVRLQFLPDVETFYSGIESVEMSPPQHRTGDILEQRVTASLSHHRSCFYRRVPPTARTRLDIQPNCELDLLEG
jgi:hypothetical protein